MRRSREPVLWALFGAGGMAAALVLPAVAFALWVGPGLGWLEPREHAALVGLATHPLTRLVVFGVAGLAFFHWAHRFRYTLYDGLQLYHLNMLVAVVTYGVASVLTVTAAIILWTLP